MPPLACVVLCYILLPLLPTPVERRSWTDAINLQEHNRLLRPACDQRESVFKLSHTGACDSYTATSSIPSRGRPTTPCDATLAACRLCLPPLASLLLNSLASACVTSDRVCLFVVANIPCMQILSKLFICDQYSALWDFLDLAPHFVSRHPNHANQSGAQLLSTLK